MNFPLINASLNLIATVLLLVGFGLIKARRVGAHKWVMLSAFGVSILFLASYVTYHYSAGHVEFTGPPPISYLYYAILLSHIILAMTVPFLAVFTIYLGLRDRRATHRRRSSQ